MNVEHTDRLDGFPPAARLLSPRTADLRPAPGTATRGAEAGWAVPDYVIDVSRPFVPWRWTSVLLAPVELLAAMWAVPFAILLAGIPIVLVVASLYWLGRLVASNF